MDHNEYWQERMLAIEEQSHDKGMKFAEHIDKQFRLAERNINRQIDYWYNKIAMNNEISLSAAKELLRKDELKDFHMSVEEYISKGEQLDFDNSYMQELINASAKVHISRLEALKLQMQQECEVLYGNMADGLEDMLADIYTSSYYNTAYTFMKGTGVGWAFNKLDNNRIEKAINTAWTYDDNTFKARCWEHKKKLNNELNTILTQSIIRGESPQKAIEQLSKRMKVSRYNAGRLIMTESSAIYSASQKDAFKELDVERYEFVATLDSHTSETCRNMDGKIFDMKDYKVGVTAPPLHCFCYDNETEVYTSNGWKLFRELNENDLVFTIDKETLIPEWQKPINYVSYKYTGNMIHFKNDRTDILVTPNHRMLVQNMDRTVKDKSWKLRRADNIGRKSKNRMYASCEWQGEKKESIVLGGKKVDTETYLKFMAYWIADGSCTFYKGHYYVKIAQCNNQWMYNELKSLPFKIYKCKESIMIHDDMLGKELVNYGKCNEKYIPELIKGLDKDSIHTFLIAYSKTDGTLRKGKNWKGYQFNDSIQFFTTSNKLAGDIGELIMKVGGRPSYYLNHTKGKKQEFKNGTYTINHDVWTIGWNKQQYSWINNMNVADVPYDDFVYCVEVEKHNTLLVRRNGKVIWSGNCRSVTVPYYEDDLGSIGERAARGADGKTYHVPANITYKEWEKGFVGKDEQILKKLEKTDKMNSGTLEDKIKVIKDRCKGTFAEKDIKEAGKAVKAEIESQRAELEKKFLEAKAKEEAFGYDKLAAEKLELAKVNRGFKDCTELGYKTKEEAYARYKQIDDEMTELLFNQDFADAHNLRVEVEKAYNGTFESNAKQLKDVLSRIRDMGSGSLDVKGHLNNSRSPMRKVVEKAYDCYPTEWIEKSMQCSNLKVKKVNRGYYSHFESVLAISDRGGDGSFSTAIHELGHRFERVADLLQHEKVFYERRTKGEELQWLGGCYSYSEKSRFDDFLSKYMGKDYGGTAYELVSMGFQYAYTEPATLLKDEDMAEWIYGLLALK